MVIKEAMAMEMPVVATRFMGIKEIDRPRKPAFSPSRPIPHSLAEAIDRLVRLSPAERAAMGRRARERDDRALLARSVIAARSRSVFEAA